MEEKVLLEVVVSNQNEIQELIDDPKVYGKALAFLIEYMRVGKDPLQNLVFEDDVFKINFLF